MCSAFGARRISARRLANTTTSGVSTRLHLRVSSQTKLQRAWWTRQLRQQRGPSLSCCVPVPRRVTFTTGGGRAQICFRWGTTPLAGHCTPATALFQLVLGRRVARCCTIGCDQEDTFQQRFTNRPGADECAAVARPLVPGTSECWDAGARHRSVN